MVPRALSAGRLLRGAWTRRPGENVKLDQEACIHCNACKRSCLADPVILEPVLAGEDAVVRAGDCMACGACIDACPTKALSFGLGRGAKPAETEEPAAEHA